MAMFEIDRPYRKPKPEPLKRRCHRCAATGFCACGACGGSGKIATSRNVFGEPNFVRCSACFGRKTRRCTTCAGIGFNI